MTKETERSSDQEELQILGRLIGTYSDMDQVDPYLFVFYDFIPAPEYKGPVGKDLTVDFEKGICESNEQTADLIDSVKDCARV